MRYRFSAVILFLLLLPAVINAQPAPEIEALLKSYCAAVQRGDTSALNSLFADDMIVTSANGNLRTKKEEIADLVIQGVKIYFFKTEDVQIRRFDGAGVATGRLVWKMNFQGRDSEVQRRFTFTVAGIDGNWKIVAQHIGRTPQ